MRFKARIIFSLIFIAMLGNKAFAQKEFILNAVLFENQTKVRLALAEIKNKRSGFSVGSNDLGIFRLKVYLGDTILVTKRNFNDLEVVVSNDKDLVLYLNKGTTLNEVVITRQTKKRALEEIKKEFKNKGSFYGGKPPLSLLSPFGGSPLTFFYELFGKTPKQARRFNKMYLTEMEDGQVDHLFNKATINQQTGLTGKELENFLVNYRPTYEQSKNWNVYDSINWIKESYNKYSDTAGKYKSQQLN